MQWSDTSVTKISSLGYEWPIPLYLHIPMDVSYMTTVYKYGMLVLNVISAVAVLSILVVFFDEVTINDKIHGISSLSRLSLLVSIR